MVCKLKIKCDLCGVEITKNNFTRHRENCIGPKTDSPYKGNRGGWNRGLSKDSNDSLAKASKTLKDRISRGEYKPTVTPHTEEFKARQSKRAYERKLGGHTSKRKIFYKMKDGTEVYLQSSYEILFATLLDEMNIEWSRPEPLEYIGDDGKHHRYYPDLKISSVYVDTKNDYLAVKDLPKIDAVHYSGKGLLVLGKRIFRACHQ
jgi:hypothetical protein